MDDEFAVALGRVLRAPPPGRRDGGLDTGLAGASLTD